MVADSHPIHHPPKTIAYLRRVALSVANETPAKMTAQTIAQAML
jgi:hypothetical protein